MTAETLLPSINVVVSSEMSSHGITRRIAPEADHYARMTGLELVIGSWKDLMKPLPGTIFSGVHFRPTRWKGFEKQIGEIIPQVAGLVRGSGVVFVGDPYLSFHTDLLARLDDPKKYLRELDILAKKNEIKILIENTTPREDKGNKLWCYDPHEFVQMFRDVLDECPNIRVNLDLAHLGLSTEKPYQALHKFYLAAIHGKPIEQIINEMTSQEAQIFNDMDYIISKTDVIHWSRTRGKPMEQRPGFRIAQAIISRLPESGAELFHNKVYSKLENFLHGHFSIISNPALFVELLYLLNYFGFRGLYVIESPGSMQIARERKIPFREEIDAIKAMTQSFLGLLDVPHLRRLANG